MPTEEENTIRALQYAIQMEIDGKAFYLQASRESGNELGRKLLESLANQEDYHRQKFEQIYENVRRTHGWTGIGFQTDGGKSLRTIFAKELQKPEPKFEVARTELDAVEKAMELEDKSFDFYHNQSENTGPSIEHDFYETIASEEREHKLVLLDYFEFLKDPSAWYVKAEHHSLDGG
jgi:rubrerythrin